MFYRMDLTAPYSEYALKGELKEIEEQLFIPEGEHEERPHTHIFTSHTNPNVLIPVHHKIAGAVGLIVAVTVCIWTVLPSNGACLKLLHESVTFFSLENAFLTGVCLGTVLLVLSCLLDFSWLLFVFIYVNSLKNKILHSQANGVWSSLVSSVAKDLFWLSVISIVLFVCSCIAWECCYGHW